MEMLRHLDGKGNFCMHSVIYIYIIYNMIKPVT